MTLPTLEPFWDWSPKAVTWFFKAAHVQGRKQLFIREGMNAALAEDLPTLAPAMARFWIETLAESGALDNQVLTMTRGEDTFQLAVTKDLLLSLCMLDTPLPAAQPEPLVLPHPEVPVDGQ